LQQVNTGSALLSSTDPVLFSQYDADRDFRQVLDKYHQLQPLLKRMVSQISACSGEQIQYALRILELALNAGFQLDSTQVNPILGMCAAMLKEMNSRTYLRARDAAYDDWISHRVDFQRESHQGLDAQALLDEYGAIDEVEGKAFPREEKSAALLETYRDAIGFDFEQHLTDSVAILLTRVQDQPFRSTRLLYLDGISQLEAMKGNFKAAYDHLRDAFLQRDSTFYQVSSSKDNDLTALAQSEYTENQWYTLEISKQAAVLSDTILFSLLGLLVISSLAAIVVARWQQRQHLVMLQLGLARNFHDEIGPMLLFAANLAGRLAHTNPTSDHKLLKSNLDDIRETVRSISHDLSASKIDSAGGLFTEVVSVLEKVKHSTHIRYKAKVEYAARSLSHVQLDHLRKIMNEAISNSVKHADCTHITFYLKASERELKIAYTDNGKGLPVQIGSGGIGLKNIKERLEILGASYHIGQTETGGFALAFRVPLG
jgi:signal transduction histidine kinase